MDGNKAYYIQDEDIDTWNFYETLLGPDEFSCTLTEPEDRTFFRDLCDIIVRLNEQHEEIVRLKAELTHFEARQCRD